MGGGAVDVFVCGCVRADMWMGIWVDLLSRSMKRGSILVGPHTYTHIPRRPQLPRRLQPPPPYVYVHTYTYANTPAEHQAGVRQRHALVPAGVESQLGPHYFANQQSRGSQSRVQPWWGMEPNPEQSWQTHTPHCAAYIRWGPSVSGISTHQRTSSAAWGVPGATTDMRTPWACRVGPPATRRSRNRRMVGIIDDDDDEDDDDRWWCCCWCTGAAPVWVGRVVWKAGG